jgi:hypothetical protein
MRRVGLCGGDAPRRLATECIEEVEVRSGVELGIFDARNHQRRDRQIGIGAERKARETLDELLGNHLPAGYNALSSVASGRLHDCQLLDPITKKAGPFRDPASVTDLLREAF